MLESDTFLAEAVNQTDLREGNRFKAGPDDVFETLTRVTEASPLLYWVDHWDYVQVESTDHFADGFAEGADCRGISLGLGNALRVQEENHEVHLVACEADTRMLVPLPLVLSVGSVKPENGLAEVAPS